MPGMAELTLTDRVIVPEAVISRELDGETVVLNLETGVYFGLDGVGTDVWNSLQNGRRVEDAFNAVLTQYDVQPATLKDDLLRFVNQLASKGLLQAGA
jgi:hypothetical protein